jgi:hypothetical protein
VEPDAIERRSAARSVAPALVEDLAEQCGDVWKVVVMGISNDEAAPVWSALG